MGHLANVSTYFSHNELLDELVHHQILLQHLIAQANGVRLVVNQSQNRQQLACDFTVVHLVQHALLALVQSEEGHAVLSLAGLAVQLACSLHGAAAHLSRKAFVWVPGRLYFLDLDLMQRDILLVLAYLRFVVVEALNGNRFIQQLG